MGGGKKMGILSDLFSSGTSGVIDSIGKAIDDNSTSDEERLALRNALANIKSNFKVKQNEFELALEKEVTSRQKIDMSSDSWLSKNIRPMSFIYMLLLTSLFTFTDGNIGSFTVKVGWIELWTTLTVAFAVFYAGGRSIEKYKSIAVKRQNLDAYED